MHRGAYSDGDSGRIQETMTMVIIRGPQEVRVVVVMMMRGECEYTDGEK